MKNLIIIFLLCILSGCATFGQMEMGLNALNGEKIQTVFNLIGYPNQKQAFGDELVYYWSSESTGSLIFPQTNNIYGTVENVPVYGTMRSNQIIPIQYTCLIKIITDKNETIKKWEYSGNIGGCEPYIDRLYSYYKIKSKTIQNNKELSSDDNDSSSQSMYMMKNPNRKKELIYK